MLKSLSDASDVLCNLLFIVPDFTIFPETLAIFTFCADSLWNSEHTLSPLFIFHILHGKLSDSCIMQTTFCTCIKLILKEFDRNGLEDLGW